MHPNSLKQQTTQLDQKTIEILLEIEEWEVVCPNCKGESFLSGDWWECNKCWGHGKLDWIEKIVGKEPPPVTSGSSSSSSCSSYSGRTKKVLKVNFKNKGDANVNKNLARSRTVQRFPKMFNKLKRGM